MIRVMACPAYSNKHLNPYNYLLYSNIHDESVDIVEYSTYAAIRGKFGILHFHWPEAFVNENRLEKALLQFVKLLIVLTLHKMRRGLVLWTVHNTEAHDTKRSWLSNLFMLYFINVVDYHIHLSNSGRAATAEKYPRLSTKPHKIIPHGHYKDVLPNSVPRSDARERLNIDAEDTVLLFFGQIKPYKNVEALISSLKASRQKNIRLVIAGKPSSYEYKSTIEGLVGTDSRIVSNLSFINDEDVQIYMNASNLVILPYNDILNSGSAIMALSFSIPVVVPARGAMSDLQDIVGKDWVFTYEGEFSCTILEEAISWLKGVRRNSIDLTQLNWNAISKSTVEAYKGVVQVKGLG